MNLASNNNLVLSAEPWWSKRISTDTWSILKYFRFTFDKLSITIFFSCWTNLVYILHILAVCLAWFHYSKRYCILHSKEFNFWRISVVALKTEIAKWVYKLILRWKYGKHLESWWNWNSIFLLLIEIICSDLKIENQFDFCVCVCICVSNYWHWGREYDYVM